MYQLLFFFGISLLALLMIQIFAAFFFLHFYTYQDMVEPSTQEEMEIHERAMKHVREMGEERKRSSLKRRLMMRLRKDGYDASLCRSSWVATTEHPGGNVTIRVHEF